MAIRAVFFDVGETLIDLTSIWNGWADWFGVPRERFLAALREGVRSDGDAMHAFNIFRPGFDLQREEEQRLKAGVPNGVVRDLWPDVLPCLAQLKTDGYLLGVSGNQTAEMEAVLRELDLPVDVLGSSASWGVEKPAAEFFQHIAELSDMVPSEIAYVGDRVDHDVVPARSFGMASVLVRRGLWGPLHALIPESCQAHVQLDSLAELSEALKTLC